MKSKIENSGARRHRRIFILATFAILLFAGIVLLYTVEFGLRVQKTRDLNKRIDNLQNLVRTNAAYNKALFKGYEKREKEAADFFYAFTAMPYVYRPFIGFRSVPNYHHSTINTNSLSYRGPEFDVVKEQGVFRILIYGGSFVWGTGALSDDETVAGHLQKILDKSFAGQRRFEVINCGESSYRTSQEAVFLMIEGVYLNPDLVIFLDGANDTQRWNPPLPSGYPIEFEYVNKMVSKHNPRLRKAFTIDDELEYLKGQRDLVWSMKAESELLSRFRRLSGCEARNKPQTGEQISPYEYALRHFYNLKSARGMGREFGFQFAFAVQPVPVAFKPLHRQEKEILGLLKNRDPYYTILKYWEEHYITYTDAVVDLCRTEGIPVLDLKKVFENNSDPLYFDHVHVTGDGYRIVAESLHEWLDKTGMLTPKTSD